MKTCCVENCVNECELKRRYCREHYLQRKREQAHIRYEQQGKRTYKRVCEMCDNQFDGDRPTSRFCSSDCYYRYSRINSSSATNNYARAHGGGYSFAHRRIVEETLHRKLTCDEVIHHLDGNPKNNDLSNLIVISRSDHAKLHSILTRNRAALLKNNDVNSENCWNNLRDQITKTWLETTGVNVIKISDIGQSAAETLPDNTEE